MAEEVVDARGIDVAGIDQRNVLVNADIKQVRQQADVLAQEQRAIGFGFLPGRVVQVRACAIRRQPLGLKRTNDIITSGILLPLKRFPVLIR